jgi:hypothetical protein
MEKFKHVTSRDFISWLRRLLGLSAKSCSTATKADYLTHHLAMHSEMSSIILSVCADFVRLKRASTHTLETLGNYPT